MKKATRNYVLLILLIVIPLVELAPKCAKRCIKFLPDAGDGCRKCDNQTDQMDDVKIDRGEMWNDVIIAFQTDDEPDLINTSQPEGVSMAALSPLFNRWNTYPDGNGNWIIPYYIAPNLNSEITSLIHDAIADYESSPFLCFDFAPRQTETNYINFQDNGEGGCWSYIGRRSTEPNDLQLSPNCNSKGVILHEIMHALGFFHEHQRPDRDEYVTIHWENIITDKEGNFLNRSAMEIDSLGIPYDIGSIMQYFDTAFSSNGEKTITDKNGQALVTQQEYLAQSDIYQISLMYNCPNAPTVTTAATTTATTNGPDTTSTATTKSSDNLGGTARETTSALTTMPSSTTDISATTTSSDNLGSTAHDTTGAPTTTPSPTTVVSTSATIPSETTLSINLTTSDDSTDLVTPIAITTPTTTSSRLGTTVHETTSASTTMASHSTATSDPHTTLSATMISTSLPTSSYRTHPDITANTTVIAINSTVTRCQDNPHVNCTLLKQHGVCHMYQQCMATICPAGCGLCGGATAIVQSDGSLTNVTATTSVINSRPVATSNESCQNHALVNCALLKEVGACESYKTCMEILCPLECEMCGASGSALALEIRQSFSIMVFMWVVRRLSIFP